MLEYFLKDKIPTDKQSKDYELFKLNRRALYAHLFNFILQIGLYQFQTFQYDLRITEIEYGLSDRAKTVTNQFNQNNFTRLNKSEVTKFKLPLAIIIGAFSYMSFLGHLSILILGGKYYGWIEYQKINYARWIEYFISSPTMMVIIASITRCNTKSILNLITSSSAITMAFGLISEIVKDDKQYGYLSKIFFTLGVIPFRSSWYPIVKKFSKSMKYVDGEFQKDYKQIYGEEIKDFDIPSFVKYTIYLLYGLYHFFPINMWLQRFYLPKRPKRTKFLGIKYGDDPYFFGEKGFIYLSFISKATLTWMLFSGTVREDESKWLTGDDYYNDTNVTNISQWWIMED